MDRIAYIYALCGEDGRVRYIGKTEKPKERLIAHRCAKSGEYKCRWVQAERKAGRSIGMVILESCPLDRWEERERFWIKHGQALGWKLTNLKEGGEGGSVGISDAKRQNALQKLWGYIPYRPERIFRASNLRDEISKRGGARMMRMNKTRNRRFTDYLIDHKRIDARRAAIAATVNPLVYTYANR